MIFFIQPYTPNKTHLRWNRLKKITSFLNVLWLLVDWRPPSGQLRPETFVFRPNEGASLVGHDIWIPNTKKQQPRNQETNKPRNQQTWNLEGSEILRSY